MRQSFLLLPLVFLAACTTIESKWMEKAGGHTFEIWTIRGDDSFYVNVINPARGWEGAFKGGAEKIPERKQLLLSIAEKEAKKMCGGKSFTHMEDSPFYDMVDKDPLSFGGGLIGYAIASASVNEENIPVRGMIHFKCADAK